ncbi:DUF3105 domain-containing protein [Modestobacter sp. I12A-02628]|uniref:DUF3105 domain-containing protein n=1 Tax=Goekera deserti TaxID=2497753 RepID=A0A7K3W7K2_9ACTN|nr:DUF3105 domain-containing protein [Goekera deserti]MPQ99920.1 DUF3105 domain-containing protein [Goekera deserti]NDI50079.1 DUF3105 domain-containing protein [Goekera deserti]NEL52445.1 DUF3105 domain-containing protein [Goekera deserti]
MAKDPDPQDRTTGRKGSTRATGGRDSAAAKAGAKAVGKAAAAGGRSDRSSRPSATARGKGGRTRPPTQVVAQPKPWGLIAAAAAVVVFAAAVIGYAVVQVREKNENSVASAEDISGIRTFDYANGQEHVATPVDYSESPPVGGPHDPYWADCTGTVYSIPIRTENAVHSEEHGAVWITYDPDAVSDGDLDTLTGLVDGRSGMMLSPYPGQSSPIMLQAWNHQLGVDSASDVRVQQFIDTLLYDPENTPEPGASCENPEFAANPLAADAESAPIGNSDAPTTTSPATGSGAPATPAP